MWFKRATCCPAGHEYTPDNTTLRKHHVAVGKTYQYCKTCARLRTRNYKRRCKKLKEARLMAKAPTTKAEILAKIVSIENDSKNLNPPGSFSKWKKSATRRIDDLRRQVASIIRTEKLARGEYVNDAGYSGRQTNRR